MKKLFGLTVLTVVALGVLTPLASDGGYFPSKDYLNGQYGKANRQGNVSELYYGANRQTGKNRSDAYREDGQLRKNQSAGFAKMMLYEHLDLLKAGAQERMDGDYEKEISSFE
ncbi:MAG: hypothetical protein V1875_06540 [Candidatus Altiarchaeota archaeon]